MLNDNIKVNSKWTLKLIRFKCFGFLPSRHIHAAIRTSWTGRTWRGWHRGRVILLFLFIFFAGQLRQFGPFWRLNYLESANISNIPGRIQKLANFGNASSHSESNGAYNCEIILNTFYFQSNFPFNLTLFTVDGALQQFSCTYISSALCLQRRLSQKTKNPKFSIALSNTCTGYMHWTVNVVANWYVLKVS